MTKKHFEAVASTFKHELKNNCHSEEAYEMALDLAKGLCVAFRKFNANFREEQFLKACGFNDQRNGMVNNERD